MKNKIIKILLSIIIIMPFSSYAISIPVSPVNSEEDLPRGVLVHAVGDAQQPKESEIDIRKKDELEWKKINDKISKYEFSKKIKLKNGKNINSYHCFELDEDILEKYNNDILILNKAGFKEVPYYIYSYNGERKCKTTRRKYKKLYQKKNKNGDIEILLDTENIKKSEEIIVAGYDSSFRASFEVFGSNLKNSKYKKINQYGKDGYNLINIKKSSETIKAFGNYRFIKIIFNIDEGNIDNLDFSYDERECANISEYSTIIEPNSINKEKKDNSIEYNIDLGRKNINISKINIELKNNETFSTRNFQVFGANSKNAIMDFNYKRHDIKKDYWKRVASFNVKPLGDNEFILNNSKYQYYKIIVTGGEKDIDFNIKFIYLKKYIFFQEPYPGNLFIYYGSKSPSVKHYADFEENLKIPVIAGNGDGFIWKYTDLIKENKFSLLEKEEKNPLFEKDKKLSKKESKYIIYIAIFFLVAFLTWYIVRIFKDLEEKK